jgi:hypothetical protein
MTSDNEEKLLYNERYLIIEKIESSGCFGSLFKVKDEKDKDIRM